jgi:hypothetical protein
MRRRLWAGAAVLIAAAAAALAGVTTEPKTGEDLIVHEWGTFLAMGGSDGVTLDGMYHEEHALPAFVHARSRDQLRLPTSILKGETPVIYFYTDKAQKVRVEVKFPEGVWTQWYPQAQVLSPALSQVAKPLEARNGRILWCAEVIPASLFRANPRQSFIPFDLTGQPANPLIGQAEPPPVGDDALWKYAREVDAAIVRTPDFTRPDAPAEVERFLFYRGLGQAPLPFTFSAENGGTLQSSAGDRHGARHIFVLRIENGRGSFAYKEEIQPGEKLTGLIPSLEECSEPVDRLADELANALAERLEESGLYTKEARAMVNTWKTSYFQSDGVRALVVMPQEWTDEFIPITVNPKPRELVRVMVGRIELLTPQREQTAEAAIQCLGAPDTGKREWAFNYLRDQGRYVEPIIRRILHTTRDESVRARCRQLLATGFVTELRSSAHAASDGRRVEDDPVFIRAQLAALLDEIGLVEEAKAEGKATLDALKTRAMPAMDHPDSRQFLRAYARASEALGDDRAAADWYARFIRFGSQVGRIQNCVGCHGDSGPKDLAWFRDWWAGAKYAELTNRLGETEPAIAVQETVLRLRPDDDAARMMLSYLYAAKGDTHRAQAVWPHCSEDREVAAR